MKTKTEEVEGDDNNGEYLHYVTETDTYYYLGYAVQCDIHGTYYIITNKGAVQLPEKFQEAEEFPYIEATIAQVDSIYLTADIETAVVAAETAKKNKWLAVTKRNAKKKAKQEYSNGSMLPTYGGNQIVDNMFQHPHHQNNHTKIYVPPAEDISPVEEEPETGGKLTPVKETETFDVDEYQKDVNAELFEIARNAIQIVDKDGKMISRDSAGNEVTMKSLKKQLKVIAAFKNPLTNMSCLLSDNCSSTLRILGMLLTITKSDSQKAPFNKMVDSILDDHCHDHFSTTTFRKSAWITAAQNQKDAWWATEEALQASSGTDGDDDEMIKEFLPVVLQ